MQKEPSTNGPNGRDTCGRFAAGNHFGKGNPLANEVYSRRQAFYAAVSEADLVEILHAVVARAKGGDLAAARLVIEATVGRPGVLAPLDAGESWLDSLDFI
jgi:hypothetical protein